MQLYYQNTIYNHSVFGLLALKKQKKKNNNFSIMSLLIEMGSD